MYGGGSMDKSAFFSKKQSFWVDNLILVKNSENFFLADF